MIAFPSNLARHIVSGTHLQGRLSELSSENRRMHESNREREASETWIEEDHQEKKEMEILCDQPGPCEPEKETKGMLWRFLRGLQPVSYVYWED